MLESQAKLYSKFVNSSQSINPIKPEKIEKKEVCTVQVTLQSELQDNATANTGKFKSDSEKDLMEVINFTPAELPESFALQTDDD